MPPKFEKLGLKGLELPTTLSPRIPAWDRGALVLWGAVLVSPGMGHLPQQLWAGRLASLGQYWGK